MPRLVFLLGEDAEGPAALFRDLEYRRPAGGVPGAAAATAAWSPATVSSPAELETALLHALTALPRPGRPGVPVGRVWNIPARLAGSPAATTLLAELGAALAVGGRRWCRR